MNFNIGISVEVQDMAVIIKLSMLIHGGTEEVFKSRCLVPRSSDIGTLPAMLAC
jgi:hypothetical protein